MSGSGRADAAVVPVPPKAYLAHGDIVADYRVPKITGLLDDSFTEYGVLVAHSCELDAEYTPVATAWREETFIKVFEKTQMQNILAGKVLQFFPLSLTDRDAKLTVIVDLHHLATFSVTGIRTWRKVASLDHDETERLQAALVHDFALRTVTREKRLVDFEGRTIQRIRAVSQGNNQSLVTVTVEDDDAFQLWLHPRKQ
jgi:hypothetical protein